MFDALRACWVPPPKDEARRHADVGAVLLQAQRRDHRYAARDLYQPRRPPETREIYRNAITAALERCTPLPFTDGLGGAVAGRPIAIRFVDNRNLP